jgi:hypothetical protein
MRDMSQQPKKNAKTHRLYGDLTAKPGLPSRLWLVLALLMLLCLPEAVFGGTLAAVETDTVRIAWVEGSGDLVDWKVRAGQNHGRANWHSLVTRDGNRQVVSRHLALKGKNGMHGAWHASGPACTASQSQYVGKGLLAERRLCKTETPYRLRLEISLKNVSDRVLPDVPLALAQGPGLGESPIEGLGIAESLYSYVQPVYAIDGGVSSFGMKSGDQRHRIDLKDKKCRWAGLQSRYFALLLAPADASACRAVEYGLPESSWISGLPERYMPEMLIFLDARGLKPAEVRKYEFIVCSGPKSLAALDAGAHDFRKI